MQASERHGFEGEGFSYLKSPVWWGGVITCTLSSRCTTGEADRDSGCWGSVQFRRLCLCARHPGHPIGCAERLDRVSLSVRCLHVANQLGPSLVRIS